MSTYWSAIIRQPMAQLPGSASKSRSRTSITSRGRAIVEDTEKATFSNTVSAKMGSFRSVMALTKRLRLADVSNV